MDLISSRTEMGVAFATDARLRPDGEKGLLVNTLEAYEDYYRHRAQLWEIQAHLPNAPRGGKHGAGPSISEARGCTDKFHARKMCTQTSSNVMTVPRACPDFTLDCPLINPGWKREIHRMRAANRKRAHTAGTGRAGDQDRRGRIDGCRVPGANLLPRARLAGAEHLARLGTRAGRGRAETRATPTS